MRFFSWFCKSREKSRPTRTEVKPRAEQLDERAVPAPLGFGFGGLATPSFGAFSRFGGPSFSAVGNNTFGFNQGVSRFGAFNRPFLAFNRPVLNPTSPNDFPFGPGGFFAVTTTPGGMAGLRQFGFGGTGFNTSASPGFATNPTSPNDFPFGPGGFFAVTTTPDGMAGLRNSFNVRF